jgi:hypothetical protein
VHENESLEGSELLGEFSGADGLALWKSMFVIAVESAPPAEALELGRAAFKAYGPTNPRCRSRVAIKVWLMDQKRVVGVGNIYASEALFRARVGPAHPRSRCWPTIWRTSGRARIHPSAASFKHEPLRRALVPRGNRAGVAGKGLGQLRRNLHGLGNLNWLH